MKKILFTFIVVFAFIPLVLASDVNYDITNYYINADIKTNGDLKVTELIVLDGTFNGYIRDIVYKNSNLTSSTYENNTIYNASGIEIESVSAKLVSSVTFDTINDTDFTPLTSNQSSNLGFVESYITNGKSYKMYYRSNNQKVAFKLTYTVSDVVVMHEDVAELYWTFIGDDYEDVIRNLQIKVNLPGTDTSDNFRVWAHGDLAGEIQKYDGKYLMATASRLDEFSSVDIRTTFDNSLLNANLVSKKETDNALSGILEVEQKRADAANKERKAVKIKYYSIIVSSIIWFVVLIILWIYIYLKYDKEYKSTFNNKYNREFIDTYNVEVIDYLFHKNITPNALSASIMNLIYKKNIKVEEIPSDKKKKEYTFILESEENTSDTEKYLINFLFRKIGKDNKLTSKELQNYAKSSSTCESFSSSYTSWKNKVIGDGKKEEFYEEKSKPKIVGTIMFLIYIFITFLAASFNVENVMVYLLIFVAIIFVIYTFTLKKRSVKGSEHYFKWKAFKNFLKDFGRFDLKELPEIALWERYMVYATVFGLASEVSKVMNVKIKELETSGVYVNYNPTFTDWYLFNSIDNIVTSSVHSNVSAVNQERANSISSSGSGSGGGFSGGGGFGGGGGGGHGF